MIEVELIDLMSTPNALLKETLVEARPEAPYQTPYAAPAPWEHTSIFGELYNWRRQFVGRSCLEFKHCALTIHIRRNHDLQNSLDAFFRAWEEEAAFLVKALNVKWLISACDSFADHSPDDAERAAALAAAALVKTIKIYETERLFRYERLEPARQPGFTPTQLFDGLNTFNIGYGDVVSNFKARIKSFARRGTPAAMILDEIFDRICTFDTAFARWRAEHVHDPTRW